VEVGFDGRREFLPGWVSSILGLLRPPVRLPEPFTKGGAQVWADGTLVATASVIIFCWVAAGMQKPMFT
jgi:hypothetical protein